MKLLAPSKRLKANLKRLKDNLKHLYDFDSFASIRDKFNPHGGEGDYGGTSFIKEVDQLFVFAPAWHMDGGDDFGIGFNWLGRAPEEMTAVVFVRHHLKSAPWNDHLSKLACDLNQRMLSSKEMGIDDFRQKLNLFIKLTADFRDKKYKKPDEKDSFLSNQAMVAQILGEVFAIDNAERNAQDLKLLAAARKELELKVVEFTDAVTLSKKHFESTSGEYLLAKKMVSDAVNNSPEAIEMAKLMKRVDALKLTIASNHAALDIKHDTERLKVLADEAETCYENDARARRYAVSRFAEDFPAHIAARLKI